MTAKCKKNGCDKQSSYNVPEETRPILCKEHKPDRMIDVVNRNKNCQHKTCRKRASFNVAGERAMYCDDHKKKNMVDASQPNQLTSKHSQPIVLQHHQHLLAHL